MQESSPNRDPLAGVGLQCSIGEPGNAGPAESAGRRRLDGARENELAATPTKPEAENNPCRVQNGNAVNQMKAIGTEPFWAAEVDGRCVIYKTPEDQQGTRIWTRFDAGPQGQAWKGALNGQEFQLVVKSAGSQGCSDGMSDKTYPMNAVLRVEGETRKGCAEPR